MGCSACGQRYRKSATIARSHGVRAAAKRTQPRTFGFVREVSVSKEPEQSKTPVVQPQPEQADIVTKPECEIEPATGQSLSLIKNGISPEASLGDTQLKPLTGVVYSSGGEADG